MKKLFILNVCIVITITCFLTGLFSIGNINVLAAEENAVNVPADYEQVSSNNQLGEAFLSYCKSRDSEITSSTLGASVTAAYNSLAKFCNYAGFNIADLQSHLWYLNENGQTKWFFDSTGINLYNRAFAYLIQENGLDVGDPADVELYDGQYFVDDDGNSCIVYVLDFSISSSLASVRNDKSHILKYGSPIKYDFYDLKSMCSVNSYVNLTFNIYGRSYVGDLTAVNTSSNGLGYSCFNDKFFMVVPVNSLLK